MQFRSLQTTLSFFTLQTSFLQTLFLHALSLQTVSHCRYNALIYCYLRPAIGILWNATYVFFLLCNQGDTLGAYQRLLYSCFLACPKTVYMHKKKATRNLVWLTLLARRTSCLIWDRNSSATTTLNQCGIFAWRTKSRVVSILLDHLTLVIFGKLQWRQQSMTLPWCELLQFYPSISWEPLFTTSLRYLILDLDVLPPALCLVF